MRARPSRWFVSAALAALAALAVAGNARAQVAGDGPVRYGMALSTDTVTVGDVFRLSVRVHAPIGSTIAFPGAPDTTATVQAVDSVQVTRAAAPGAVEETATWRLAAWNVGQQPVTLGDIVVQTPDGERRIAIRAATIFVRSVLPEDSTQRVPKPARPLFEQPVPPIWPWILLAVAAIALLAWWLWRRRARAAAFQPGEDAYVHAQREFARVEMLRLVDAGEPGRHAALMVEVLRDYLARRFGPFPLALTSTELLAATSSERMVPQDRLAPLLAEVDLVKFARRPVSGDRARQLGTESREIVQRVEAAVVAARKAAEERAAREREQQKKREAA